MLEARKKSTGTVLPILADNSGSLIVAGGLGQAAIDGRLYYAATASAVACSTDLNATFTGLAIGNPLGSGKNYAMWEFGYAWTTVVTNETDLGLAVGDLKGLANADPSEVKSALIGGAMNSKAIKDEAGNITAPTKVKFVASLDDMVAEKAWASPPQVVDLKGSIVLSPGTAIFTNATYATGTVMLFHFVWEEIDI